jgi:hypothetical protein
MIRASGWLGVTGAAAVAAVAAALWLWSLTWLTQVGVGLLLVPLWWGAVVVASVALGTASAWYFLSDLGDEAAVRKMPWSRIAGAVLGWLAASAYCASVAWHVVTRQGWWAP